MGMGIGMESAIVVQLKKTNELLEKVLSELLKLNSESTRS